ncbi:MAG: pilus assembly protein PilM [Puniceicoccales bacterium]|jgi:type IV pilus assembly protein PilM|nr:pilus assembly protein PilM [Puniceicoccales bacterium]
MSSANPIIVNCGATHVSVSVFSADGARLRLEKFFVHALSYNYSSEEEWLLALTRALHSIVRNAHLGGPVSVIVPGYRLLTKNVRVAQVEADRQRQIIVHEAQNSLLDAHDMVWDSQLVATDGVEAEVVLFAHRIGDAVLFTEAVRSTGVKPVVVEAATLMDYQAYRLYRESREDVAHSDVLLVNIGARSTNLTFVSNSGFGIQNISIGGNWLTQMIADKLGDDFRVAEELKLKYFMEQKSTPSNDPIAHTLDAQATNFARRLAQDISRRIVNYKRQNPGRAPTAIFLTGRASLLPGLAESLAEALRLPVEFFDPASILEIGPQVQRGLLESVSRFQMSEVVGEAARLVLPDPVGVNLLPGQIAEEMEFSRKKPFFLFAAILISLAPLPLGWHFMTANEEIAKHIKVVTDEYQGYNKILVGEKPGRNSTAQTVEGIKGISEKTKALAARTVDLAKIAEAKGSWNTLLHELQSALIDRGNDGGDDGEDTTGRSPPMNVWIESLSVRRAAPSPVTTAATVATNRGTPQDRSKPTATTAPKTSPQPTVKVIITVRTLLETVPPDSAFNSAAVSARFQSVREALTRLPSIQKVESLSTFDSPNLPSRTFELTIKPSLLL